MSSSSSSRTDMVLVAPSTRSTEQRMPLPSIPQLHFRPFKLRFSLPLEPGRSYVSAVKPLTVPSTVSGKVNTPMERESGEKTIDPKHAQEVLTRIEDRFNKGPREKFDKPVTTTQQYGWWCREKYKTETELHREDRRLNHHIRDSYSLKTGLRILETDLKLKQRK